MSILSFLFKNEHIYIHYIHIYNFLHLKKYSELCFEKSNQLGQIVKNQNQTKPEIFKDDLTWSGRVKFGYKARCRSVAVTQGD